MSKRIPFNIKYRPQIESGEYKVVCGKELVFPARIICWDARGVNGKRHIVVLSSAKEYTAENILRYYEDGHLISDSACRGTKDLFIVTPEEELTDFENAFGRAMMEVPEPEEKEEWYQFLKEKEAELLSLAREQLKPDINFMLENNYKTAYKEGYDEGKKDALKYLPSWRRYSDSNNRGYGIHAGLLLNGDWLIELKDLEKLPKEDEK